MKCALAGLFCALVSVSLAYAQEASRRTPAREQIGSGRQITLDVLIADLSEAVEKPTATKLLEMEKGGKLVAATRLQMAMLDELPSFIQFGGGRFASRSVPAGPRGG